ncbi:hypothetical protein [Streptomyces sp. Agncl-13]|uniref:hypothetical protein n=1 Tax=Streptomyces sp. Agncl-13 TaxID=3400628 RepID=UPI003A84106B
MAKKKPSNLAEHPPPTPATFKQLYGTAFRCAKPECREPLYRVNSDTGETILNSNVAHIHARSEGGPRWKPGMTTEENRHFDNLLPMCEAHAREIDVTPDHYPSSLLHEWKQAQSAEFARFQKGWDLSDEQVEDIASLVSVVHDAVAAIKSAMPFSPQQRPRADALELAVRRVRAARSTRLNAVAPGRIEELLRWMGTEPGLLVSARAGQFRVLVAPMGAGKTEEAWCWFEAGLQQAYDDDAVDIPVWLEAYEAARGLEDAVRARLGKDPQSRCRVVVNDLDHVDPPLARRLVADARQLVEVWPHVAVVATAQPGLDLASAEVIEIEPWPTRRGVELVQVALGSEPPRQIWTPETIELVQRPLTALALAARLAAGRTADVSRLQLLQDLPQTIIANRRPAAASPTVWDALARLAILILQARGPVRAAALGNQANVWQLTDTGLVVERDGRLSFALPVFEQHFGAQAIATEAFGIEQAADRYSFPAWRYAIASAIATSSRESGRETLLCRLAQANPAALSWAINEIESRDMRTGTRIGNNVDLTSDRTVSPCSGGRAGASIAAGSQLREAYTALLNGFGPSATALANHRDGELMQWGVDLTGDWMTLAEHRERTAPPLVALPDFDQVRDLRASGWRSTAFSYPSGEFGRWRWARARIGKGLEQAVRRRVLATSADSPLTSERMWFLSCFVTSTSGFVLGRQSIPIDEVRKSVAPMMEKVRNSVSSRWQKGRHMVNSADVIWLDAQFARFEGAVLKCPWPFPDQPMLRHQWRSQGYSPKLAEDLTTRVLVDAVAGYLDLVQTNFSAFGSALGLYSILPVDIRGTITQPPESEDGYPASLSFSWHPNPNKSSIAVPDIELRTETYPGQWPLWYAPSGTRPESRTAYHLPMVEDGVLLLGDHRPASNLAYEWLARDLHALGWLEQPITFHD